MIRRHVRVTSYLERYRSRESCWSRADGAAPPPTPAAHTKSSTAVFVRRPQLKTTMADQQRSNSRKAKADVSIMDTNDSSIVSKRSVERLYYQEPHFYRYFVKKPRTRAPLINRGYWLRMHAVEQVVKRFLEEPSKKRKVVLNLGCG